MCPASEAESRLKSNEVDLFEVIIDSEGSNNLSFKDVKENRLFNSIPNLKFNFIKKYGRSEAGKQMNNPNSIRSIGALKVTCDEMFKYILPADLVGVKTKN